MNLLTLAAPTTEFPRDVLDSAGGFLWWYLDMIDQDGNGAVVIWSYGLPFLPGYASAARSQKAPRPASRPSLNIAVYSEWELDCYLLHEFSDSEVDWTHNEWRFGDTHIVVTDDGSERRVNIDLDAPLPAGGRLRGTLSAVGTRRQATPDSSTAPSDHAWAPQLCRARGELDIVAGEKAYRFTGDGYFDGNYGSKPLGSTLRQWCWGRVAMPDRELIYYVLEGLDGARETHGIELLDTGELRRVDVLPARLEHSRSLTGLRYPSKVDIRTAEGPWLTVSAGSMLDDGPFYARHQITTADGKHGLGEYCRTDRIDLWLHRPLVRMRVQHSAERNSMWLPLFTGPRDNRVGALFSHWASSW